MTQDQAAVERLQSLGYSALQASFLWMVALHSGVFLRRQYLHFAGISSGKHATGFMDKLIATGHCRTFPLGGLLSIISTRRLFTGPSAIPTCAFVGPMDLITSGPSCCLSILLLEILRTRICPPSRKN